MELNRKHTQPIEVQRSNRLHATRALTSMPAGKMVPIAAVPLLREDALRVGRYNLSFEMMETAEILMNAVNVRVMAYLVPTLAFERFQGSMDILNRSYAGEPALDGGTVVPFIDTAPFGAHGSNEVYKYLGLHADPSAEVNTAYLEAYNLIWNHRATNRSKDLTARDLDETDLAPAFWINQRFAHILPDFDQAVIDGEVALNIVNPQIEVRGLWRDASSALPGVGDSAVYDARDGAQYTGDIDDLRHVFVELTEETPRIFGELNEAGISVSLSNIELARKTQAFARIRERYEGIEDEWIIDMLMSGLSIPDQALKQPMLLADQRTVFGMSKRYATDSGNLTESVVNGVTGVGLNIRVPRLNTGGVIMIVAEVTPEQLFERQKDPFLHATDVEQFPQYLRDVLDPEKVSIVTNDFVDVDHDTPDDTFGYAPLNHEWNIAKPTIGGRFYRPEVDAGFDEDRQRLWAVETQNPTLAEDFYLCTQMHTKPFVVTNQDPFECLCVGDAVIQGNTVFGGRLAEDSGNWDKVLEKAPMERIEQ